MKKISIVVPTYNEEKNVITAYEQISAVMREQLSGYEYEILYIDNDSRDNTRVLIESLCKQDKNVCAIFNARNFGMMRSHYYGLINATGDCAVLIHADLQNPPSVIPDFVKEWEAGYKVIIGIKDKSKENQVMFFLRSCYYRAMKNISDIEHIEHFSDFELLDRDFLDVLKNLEDPIPYLRGIVSELGFKIKRIHYIQNKRERGKSKSDIKLLYDFGMLGLTSYTKSIMRLATVLGFVLSGLSILVAISIVIMKLLYWDSYPMGVAAIGVGVFILGSVQLFFIGFLGEYVLNINTRIMRRPLVVEERRINFDGLRDP